ncbi:MAG: hypothetical protein H9W81_21990 [Enterococcus sp.]|nr:hypothetical protein [Enterococcus sp.]
MSNMPAGPGQAFVSHDGEGTEVWVQKGVGKVIDIRFKEPKGNHGRVASVEIQTEGLRYPQKAWINESAPEFEQVQKAYDEGTPIAYRIESQRKKKNTETKEEIPKETPIAELRPNQQVAKENVNNILVGVNGSLTNEHLTHPDADPAPSGRVPAQAPVKNQDAAPANNSAPSNRNQVQRSNRNVAVEEEPAWKEFNSDGTRNLGSYSVLAAFSMESFTRKALVTSGRNFTEKDVALFGQIIMAIADKIHAWASGKGRSDRMANSHTRVRGVVIDTIENILPIPTDNAQVNEWVGQVGKLALERFKAGMEIVNQSFDLSKVNEALGLVQAPNQTQRTQAPATNGVESPAVTKPNNQPQTQAERQAAAKSLLQTLENTKVEPMTMDEPASNPLTDASAPFHVFPPVEHLPALTNENRLDNNMLEQFKEFVNDANADYGKLRKLLIHTFNVEKASQVPSEQFLDFFDFYLETGEDNFLKVLDYADTIIQ